MSMLRRAARRARLVARIWIWWLAAEVALRVWPLPRVIGFMGRDSGLTHPRQQSPRRLGWMVWRALRVGPYRPRCLLRALVHYRLLAQQGTPVEFVIGLPARAAAKEAHAWLEVGGEDVGPPPGRHGHVPLARYGRSGGGPLALS